ncbi:cysteine desulfurase [Candidatus Peregrinibacteria bacterium]|nr:cysteine desulfurase [Candidatus Peregrinibacteria bacterium]
MEGIYLDHAATTYLAPEVLQAMLPYFTELYGNAESVHFQGKKAKIAIDSAREEIAKHLNCKSSEIIFTSGGTESNNLAIFGTAYANKGRGRHLVTSKIEHSSVTNCFKELEKKGFEVTWLEVDNEGFISLGDLKKALRKDTMLVSIMYANNEIGTILPVKEIGEICKEQNIPFHTDACQAAGALSLDTQDLNLTLLTLNASKIYGPKGIGALYIKTGHEIKPTQFGGSHERNIRAGTHNVPGIVGLAKALQLAQENREKENARLIALRNKLITGLTTMIPECTLNGPKNLRLPNNVNISIRAVHSADSVLQLDELGIYASPGSACKAGSSQPSHVLEAINLPRNLRHTAIRLTLGHKTTEEDIDYVLQNVPPLIEKMRKCA